MEGEGSGESPEGQGKGVGDDHSLEEGGLGGACVLSVATNYTLKLNGS